MSIDCLLVVYRDEVGGHQWSARQVGRVLDDLGLTWRVLATSGDFEARQGQVLQAVAGAPRLIVSFSEEAVLWSGVGGQIPIVERLSILRAYRHRHLPGVALLDSGVVAVVSQSARLTRVLAGMRPAGWPPIRTIPPFVDAVHDQPRSSPRERLRVLAAGRADGVKNLGAVCDLAGRTPDVAFTICTPADLPVGSGNLRAVATPCREALMREMQDADIFLTLTQSDGLANVTLDAFSLGLPVCMTDHDGWAHEQEGAALVWEGWSANPAAPAYPNTLGQIGAELRRLQADPARYRQMSTAALATAARFDYPRFRQSWRSVVEEIL